MPQVRAATYIQCTHKGLTGSFLRDEAGVLHSPIFADSADLYRFCEQRGWLQDAERREGWSSRFRNDDIPSMVAVKDLRPGDRLDLENDPIADPKGDNITLQYETVAVYQLTVETADCTLVEADDFACGFGPDHLVKVVGFDERMVEGLTGKPATLIVAGVSI